MTCIGPFAPFGDIGYVNLDSWYAIAVASAGSIFCSCAFFATSRHTFSLFGSELMIFFLADSVEFWGMKFSRMIQQILRLVIYFPDIGDDWLFILV